MTTQIETTNLTIRPFTLEDGDVLHRIWNEPGVRQFLWDDEPVPMDRVVSMIKRSQALFASDRHGLWAVALKPDHELIGFSGFWPFHEPPQVELLYGISTVHWRKGLATEAAAAMMKYGFEQLSFARIVASTDAGSINSVKVMEKLGMSFWKREISNGLDTIYYSRVI